MPPSTVKSAFDDRLERVKEMKAAGAAAKDIRKELVNLARSAGSHKERRATASWLLGVHLASCAQWKEAEKRFAKGAELSQDKYLRAQCLYALASLNYLQQRELPTALMQAQTAAKLAGGYNGCSLPHQADQLAQDIAYECAIPCVNISQHLQHVVAEILFRPDAGWVIGKAE